jgi:hypothetical protein
MEVRQTLARWMALRGDDGIDRARRVATYVSVAATVVTLGVILCALLVDVPPILLVVPAAAAGYLMAERNALQNRLAQWPALREYLDWSKIERDSVADQTSHSE